MLVRPVLRHNKAALGSNDTASSLQSECINYRISVPEASHKHSTFICDLKSEFFQFLDQHF